MTQLPTVEDVKNSDANLSPATLKDLEFLRLKMQEYENKMVVGGLAKHFEAKWEIAKRDNRETRKEIIRTFKRIRGEYDSKKLADIRAFRGSETYIRSGEQKCRAAFSWVADIYRGDTDLPWSLEPSAVPTLPDQTKQQIKQEIIKKGVQLQQELLLQEQEQGVPFDQARLTKTLNEWQQVAEQLATEAINKDAKKRCDRAAQKIRDDNQEGKWDIAFKDFLWYFVRCKAGIIKGPGAVKKKVHTWEVLPDGTFDFVAKETTATDVYAVSPFNFYPMKGVKTVNDGDIIEIHDLVRQSLYDLIGVDGYSKEAIETVLSEIKAGAIKNRWIQIDDEIQVNQVSFEKTFVPTSQPDTQSATSNVMEDKIQAMEFYGSVPGSMLIQWGMNPQGVDPHQEYQCNCWKIGKHVIKAVINPDSLGRKPYHVSSWAKSPTWLLGEGLFDMAEPLEDILNAITRAIINNIAIASGPQVVVNKDFCDDKSGVYPWKRWDVTSGMMKDGKPVDFFQPDMNTAELINAWKFFAQVLDEMTVPAYAQGASQSGVTAGTATVFTQLLAAASRSIKAVVANIDDDIITPYIQMCYDNLMRDTDDETLKGDAFVVAKGVSSLLAKEQQAQRKTELLQATANPIHAEILGAKNIGSLLAQVFKASDIKLPDMDRLEGNPTMQELLSQMNMHSSGMDMSGAQASGLIAAGGTPAQPKQLTMDGAPAGAPDMQQPAQIGA